MFESSLNSKSTSSLNIPTTVYLQDDVTGETFTPTIHYVYQGEEPSKELLNKATLEIDLLPDNRTGSVRACQSNVQVSFARSLKDQNGNVALHIEGLFASTSASFHRQGKTLAEEFEEYVTRNEKLKDLLFAPDIKNLFFSVEKRTNNVSRNLESPLSLFPHHFEEIQQQQQQQQQKSFEKVNMSLGNDNSNDANENDHNNDKIDTKDNSSDNDNNNNNTNNNENNNTNNNNDNNNNNNNNDYNHNNNDNNYNNNNNDNNNNDSDNSNNNGIDDNNSNNRSDMISSSGSMSSCSVSTSSSSDGIVISSKDNQKPLIKKKKMKKDEFVEDSRLAKRRSLGGLSSMSSELVNISNVTPIVADVSSAVRGSSRIASYYSIDDLGLDHLRFQSQNKMPRLPTIKDVTERKKSLPPILLKKQIPTSPFKMSPISMATTENPFTFPKLNDKIPKILTENTVKVQNDPEHPQEDVPN